MHGVAEGGHVDAGHDAEVCARAALEREPEVGVGRGRGLDGRAVGEDDLVAVDVVAGPAVPAGQEVDAPF